MAFEKRKDASTAASSTAPRSFAHYRCAQHNTHTGNVRKVRRIAADDNQLFSAIDQDTLATLKQEDVCSICQVELISQDEQQQQHASEANNAIVKLPHCTNHYFHRVIQCAPHAFIALSAMTCDCTCTVGV